MVDVVSIVIAIISLASVLVGATITGWFTLYADKRKRRKETEDLVSKYKDPLVFAAYELQSRIYSLIQRDLLSSYGDGEMYRDLIIIYTCFLVGQYFSWTHILQRRVQFLQFSTSNDTNKLAEKLDAITHTFATYGFDKRGEAFMLWRGSQRAIGEIMTDKEDKEYVCMRYSDFSKRWKEEEGFKGFKAWFSSIEDGVVSMARANRPEEHDMRLRHLQHLLVDLLFILQPKRWNQETRVAGRYKLKRLKNAINCRCDQCGKERVPEVHVSGKPRDRAQISGVRRWGSQAV